MHKISYIPQFSSSEIWQKKLQKLAFDFAERSGAKRIEPVVRQYIEIANTIEYLSAPNIREGSTPFANISSATLRGISAHHYRKILEDLCRNGYVANNSYCADSHNEYGAFPKSYCIDQTQLKMNDTQPQVKVEVKAEKNDWTAFQDLLKKSARTFTVGGQKLILATQQLQCGIASGDILIRHALLGIKCWRDKAHGHADNYNGDRNYNWFATTPKDFRHYIIDESGRHMTELLDLPSGNLLCLAILALRNDNVTRKEFDVFVTDIRKDLYTQIIRDMHLYEDRKAVKLATQIYINSTKHHFLSTAGEVSKWFRAIHPKIHVLIRKWRTNDKGKKTLFDDFTAVERELIESIQQRLKECGIFSLRVHDAIYTFEGAVAESEAESLIWQEVERLTGDKPAAGCGITFDDPKPQPCIFPCPASTTPIPACPPLPVRGKR